MKTSSQTRGRWLLAASACALIILPDLATAQFWSEPQYQSYRQPAGYGLMMAILRVMLIIGLGLLGFFIGWFISPKAKAFRKAVFLICGAIAALIVIFGSAGLGWALAWVLGYLAFFAGLGYWAQGVVKKLGETPTTFGSAKWADADHMKEHRLFDPKPEPDGEPEPRAPPGKGFIAAQATMSGGLFPKIPEFGDATATAPFSAMALSKRKPALKPKPPRQGIRMGFADDGEGEAPFFYREDGHLLTVAPSRAGKGTSAIIPNLLTYPGSVLVIDPKGENAMITAKAREAMGQTVHIVDPWGIAVTGDHTQARFNPMDWLVNSDGDQAEDAMILASALFKQNDHNEAFWIEEGKGLVQGIILFVATDPDEDGQRHLGRVRDLLLCDGDDLKTLFTKMLNSPHHVVASTGARALQKEDELLANVLATAQAQTHFLDSSPLRENLSASDFSFADLKSAKASIYLVLPGDRLGTFSRWLRLMVQQAITVNARNIAEKPEHPILFLLDEMAALGHMPTIEEAYGLMAGYGMQLWGIVQDLSQLKGIYGDRWQSFIGNARAIQYFGSRDEFTADYFSKLCGVTTVWNMQSAIASAVSSSRGSNGGSSSTSRTETDTRSAVQRKLIYADELMRLPKNRQLVFIENMDPIQASRRPWFDDPELKAKGVNLHQP